MFVRHYRCNIWMQEIQYTQSQSPIQSQASMELGLIMQLIRNHHNMLYLERSEQTITAISSRQLRNW